MVCFSDSQYTVSAEGRLGTWKMSEFLPLFNSFYPIRSVVTLNPETTKTILKMPLTPEQLPNEGVYVLGVRMAAPRTLMSCYSTRPVAPTDGLTEHQLSVRNSIKAVMDFSMVGTDVYRIFEGYSCQYEDLLRIVPTLTGKYFPIPELHLVLACYVEDDGCLSFACTTDSCKSMESVGFDLDDGFHQIFPFSEKILHSLNDRFYQWIERDRKDVVLLH